MPVTTHNNPEPIAFTKATQKAADKNKDKSVKHPADKPSSSGKKSSTSSAKSAVSSLAQSSTSNKKQKKTSNDSDKESDKESNIERVPKMTKAQCEAFLQYWKIQQDLKKVSLAKHQAALKVQKAKQDLAIQECNHALCEKENPSRLKAFRKQKA
ncbi:hypothetical protein BDZ97DRAFT_1929733 [Flammula alnicola]|nr:hypothetical protein BDZ97DRAFT_1929733 [Flammula alnicola]